MSSESKREDEWKILQKKVNIIIIIINHLTTIASFLDYKGW